MASAVTEEPTDAVLVPADVFRNLLTKSDAIRRFVFETTASRVVDILALVEEITVRRMDARLASLLLRRTAAQEPDAAIVVTHDELAAELGTAREVVSRVLKEMERRGALRLARGRIVVVDERVLAGFAMVDSLT
jgi:CRP/FNR family transcriptional regulator